jgi:hypothetical protein
MAEFAIDQKTIEQLVLKAVQDNILGVVENMAQDPAWLSKIEQLINQTVTYQTIAKIGSMDISTVIRDRVDENMDKFHSKMREDFSSVGIKDQATETQLTIMDDHTVFENNLTAKDLTIANSAQIQNLVVTGSINTDNFAWHALGSEIAQRTLTEVEDTLQSKMIQQVVDLIQERGIEFDRVKIDGEYLIEKNNLNRSITRTNIQKLGKLEDLFVGGPASINDTLNVINKRIGINTEEPEMALSVWDEEVAVNIGKSKSNQAYIGTSRAQSLSIGTNRIGHIEIDADGMTQIKKLRIGVHQISHADMVPGWSGTRGDIVFNTNVKEDRVFAWVCLGNFKWQPLKSAE